MLAVYFSTINFILLKKITSNANANVRNFHHYMIEYNSGNNDIDNRIYIPYVHQEQKLLRVTKYSNMNN